MQAHRLLENKDKKPQHKHTTEQCYTNTGHVSTLKPCFHPPKNDFMLWIDELAFFYWILLSSFVMVVIQTDNLFALI